MIRKIISCEVFRPYLDQLFLTLPKEEVDYLEIKQHDHPDHLAKLLQEKIDSITGVDEIIVLYGLCGNAILPLVSRIIPIRVLRVHDCAAVLLGSNSAYQKYFEGNPHKHYHCVSYKDRDDEYFARTSPEYRRIADEYGEDNADYVFEMLYDKFRTPVTYLKFGLIGEDEQISKRETGYYTIIEGSYEMLREMLTNDPHSTELTLHPGERFEGIYDYETVLKVVKIEDEG
jgi:hypothetical protein